MHQFRQNGVAVLNLPFGDLTPADIWEVLYQRGEAVCSACYFVDDGGALCGPWPTVEVASSECRRAQWDKRERRRYVSPTALDCERARAIVKCILQDLHTRSGYRQTWDGIDNEVRAEVVDTLTNIVVVELAKEP